MDEREKLLRDCLRAVVSQDEDLATRIISELAKLKAQEEIRRKLQLVSGLVESVLDITYDSYARQKLERILAAIS